MEAIVFGCNLSLVVGDPFSIFEISDVDIFF
jgi:hypothetical protein